MGAGESAGVPSAAAIANAIFDATGIRFRELPITPERVLAALKQSESDAAPAPEAAPPKRSKAVVFAANRSWLMPLKR